MFAPKFLNGLKFLILNEESTYTKLTIGVGLEVKGDLLKSLLLSSLEFQSYTWWLWVGGMGGLKKKLDMLS